MTTKPAQDRRIPRTRNAVVRAFVGLIFDRRNVSIRTAHVIAAAGIGRSTFYEHFRDKDDLLLAAIDPILLPLANAASGRAGVVVVRMMLGHLWDQRALGRIILNSTAAPKLRQRLAAMIAVRLEIEGYGPGRLALPAMAAAAGQLAMLRMWVAGEATCSIDDLARQLTAFAKLPVGQPAGR
jgi:AcrR family transcriptional regulator